jgi:hypothetical protein
MWFEWEKPVIDNSVYQDLVLGTPRSPLQERLGDQSYRAGSLDCAALKGLYLTP